MENIDPTEVISCDGTYNAQKRTREQLTDGSTARIKENVLLISMNKYGQVKFVF